MAMTPVKKITCLALVWALHALCTADNEKDSKMAKHLAENEKLQGKAEIVFLLDRSGSVGAADFEAEKGFVESFLTHIVVDYNASRVAVISYSDTAERHIDYLKEPKTKCFLAQEMHDVEYQDSGATNIATALDEARKVFNNARPNVNKVIVLISDGLATKGGDPAKPAEKLKADGVEIFCFGVGKFLPSELERIASSLKNVYTCSGFREFKRLARKIRGDPHESSWSSQTSQPNCDHLCDSPYKGDPNDPGCCDPEARCSCALKSGKHTCVCKPGYYGLSGLPGDCRACPRGTYKSKLEPSNSCTLCPLGSTTAEVGSSKLSDCYCKEGYTGNPSNEVPCEKVNCPPLQTPARGYLSGSCNTDFGSTCRFICENGYDLEDPANQEERTCKSDGRWTGMTAVCREIFCPPLQRPANGEMKCEPEPFTVGKKCRFGCKKGYTLEGSFLRECTSSKHWTGKPTNCVPSVCDLPPRLLHGIYYGCTLNEKPKYRESCIFQCNRGFVLKGPQYLQCSENGKLVDRYGRQGKPECEDVTPPEIVCPDPIRVAADKGRNSAIVKWEVPIASDNSGYEPDVIFNPPHIRQHFAFPIGHTDFECIAVDQSNLRSSCWMRIEVVDKEPPVVVRCPQDIQISTNDYEIPVFWEEPVFEDNSKMPVRIAYQSDRSGSRFRQGSVTVLYEVEDKFYNKASCQFHVIVTRSQCKYYPPPNNGALACDHMTGGYMCQAYCEEGYDFQRKPAEYYICNRIAQWETLYPLNALIPWPDCSRITVPGSVRKMVGFYYHGDCNHPAVQTAIKKLFLNHVATQIKGAELCFRDGTCSVNSVQVFCGEITERRKRDLWKHAQGEQLELEFEITINGDLEFNDAQALMQDFLDVLNNIQWDFAGDLNFATTTFSPNEPNLDERKSETLVPNEEKTTLVCKIGSVLKDEKCVLCSAGTFYDQRTKECAECPVGAYQEMEGQLECNKCPDGTSTEQPQTKNETLCKGICFPGTYSVNGLETCLACPIGTFQESKGMTSCLICPNGTTTANVGAVSVEECKDICPPGTFSQNRLEPCEPCPLHHYQPQPGEIQCLECPDQLLTAGKGAKEVDQCIDIDPCLLYDSCQNNGNCIRMGQNAKCECKEGFEGDRCEKDVDECSFRPCSNGGECINVEGSFFCKCLDGFTGKLCDIEIDECASSPCQNNGTCIDAVNGYKCICSNRFEGNSCEIERDVCFRDVVCLNDGVCMFGDNDSSFCVCEPGFAGIDCSQNFNECENITCKNNGSCIDGINSFTCACSPGYTGTYCETDIDDCENNLCLSGSTCMDLVGAYKCECLPGWNGTYCENKMDSNFILMFPDSTATIANMASMTLNSPLTDATVSLWVQTNDTDRSGTPLSYAVATTKTIGADGTVVDNALTISDCSEVKIYVNNEPILTDLQVADGQWHHLAFTWSSEDSGKWALYKDGELQSEGKNLRPHEVIHGGGNMIIGQEQDSLGGGFSPLETFTGNITRVNIWNSYFSKNNITRLCRMDDELPDKVLAWPDFLNGLKGNVQVIKNSRPTMSKQS